MEKSTARRESKGEGEKEGGGERRGGQGSAERAARGEARGTRRPFPAAHGLEAAGVSCSVGSGSGCGVLGPGGAAVLAAAAATARRPRGLAERGAGSCTPGAPGAALGRICTLPREAGSPGLALA